MPPSHTHTPAHHDPVTRRVCATARLACALADALLAEKVKELEMELGAAKLASAASGPPPAGSAQAAAELAGCRAKLASPVPCAPHACGCAPVAPVPGCACDVSAHARRPCRAHVH